ncbi:VCBS repeat-containing protein [Pirellulales bacterium]|nr:VCBS repeat-containing protein [Pirellulales bacterium]
MSQPTVHNNRPSSPRRMFFIAAPVLLLGICLALPSCNRQSSPPPTSEPATGTSQSGASQSGTSQSTADVPPERSEGADSQRQSQTDRAQQSSVDQDGFHATEPSEQSTVVTGERTRDRRKDLRKFVDPRDEGWDSEALSEQVTAQLSALGHLLTDDQKSPSVDVSQLAAADFTCGPLRPSDLETVYQGGAIEVSRAVKLPAVQQAAGGKSPPRDVAHTAQAVGGFGVLAGELKSLAEVFAGGSDVRVKFKVFQIEVSAADITTRVRFEASGLTPRGAVQQTAVWNCTWTNPSADALPLLRSIAVEEFEEVSRTATADGAEAGTILADCTEAVFGNQSCFTELLQYDVAHWAGRIERGLGTEIRGLSGMAVGDVNGDGLEDLYVCVSGGLPNQLLVQNPDGTVRAISREAGVDFQDLTMSALLADLDNDGDQDLVVATLSGLVIMSNNGAGHFQIAARLPGGDLYSLAVADYDVDSDLDLYVCTYTGRDNPRNPLAIPVPYYDSNNGLPNALYRNDGNWKFTDVTREVGLDVNNTRFSLAAAWEDYDNDGDLDLYVANDFGRNNLYRNNGSGTPGFEDVAGLAGVEDANTGMSASFGDFNRDGWMDLYVSNMWSSAGNRITYQRRFKPGSSDSIRSHYQLLARGNSLFENQGKAADSSGPEFRDVSLDAGVTLGRWAWASLFCDLNNDGWEDLFVANGYVTGERKDDL